MPEMKDSQIRTGLEVAVIGTAGGFPGAKDIHEFWNNLKHGVESISFFSTTELAETGKDHELVKNPNYVKAKGILPDIDNFDASFFGYTPKEAGIMDPQMRLFHECVWQALEDAGCDLESDNGRIGLYAGASSSFHWEALTRLAGENDQTVDPFTTSCLNNKDLLCMQISYKFNLKGPSFTLHTTCSTSLVAVHLAIQGLLGGECEIALAGGVSLSSTYTGKTGYLYQEAMIMSPDGHCRAFDAMAKGTIGGEGVGVVVLKLLEEAAAAGDHIYAIVKGSAINNDGIRKAGFTAPSVEGQAEVISAAMHMAEVEPESIGYIETHGTGTVLGDPIEIEALKLAFDTDKQHFCPIGSVKTNIGHLDTAAGIAGFIKTVLILKHRLIPPSLHFNTPNPKIDFENSPFYVATQLTQWKNDKYPLRAGVSSFGIGGTNAHVVLEEFPGFREQITDDRRQTTDDREQGHRQLILLSAKTPPALDKMTQNLVEYFKNSLLNQGNHNNPANPGLTLADAAYTLQVGRTRLEHRKMLVCSTAAELIKELTSPTSTKTESFLSKQDDRSIIYMFPGQGSQYVNMGRELYQAEPIFREEMDRCFEILKSLLDYDIKEILYPHSDCRGGSPCPPKNCVGASDQGDHRGSPLQPDRINQTEIAQPVLFIFEYALAKLLIKWGIKPYAMVGHSIGEYVAAHLSGVFSLEDTLKLVVLRGRLMQEMPPGGMLSVQLPEKEITSLLKEEISLAAVNGPSHCVVSGPHQALENLARELEDKDFKYRRLHTSHAFHSKMMGPILKEFEKEVGKVTRNRPEIPYISNVTGDWIMVEQAADPGYWSTHLRETVYFEKGIKEFLKEDVAIFVEVGPGKTLGAFVRQHTDKKTSHRVINLVKHPREDISDTYLLLDKIGQLWLYGIKPDWSAFYANQKRYRVSLPTYPFQRQKYHTEGNLHKFDPGILAAKASLTKKPGISDWFYIPSWKRTGFPLYNETGVSRVFANSLIFTDDCGIGLQFREKLVKKGQEPTIARTGTTFTTENHRIYHLNPKQPKHYELLFRELKNKGAIPAVIIHLWSLSLPDRHKPGPGRVREVRDVGFYSLVNIARAIGKLGFTGKIQLVVVTNNLHEVTGEEQLCPGNATILGPINVIPQEYPNISCRSIDILLANSPGKKNKKDKKLIQRLLAEFNRESREKIVAHRGNHRWVQSFEQMPLEKPNEKPGLLKERGVYMIVGGLGNIGLILAEYLAKSVRARLILTGRSSFPAKEDWQKWLDTHDNTNRTSHKILKIRELEKSGAKVLVFRADTANKKQMQQAIDQAEKLVGKPDGVIHSASSTKNGFKAIRDLETSLCEEEFQAKINGLLVLEDILKDKNIDFCLLMSSLSSVLGGLGFAAYSSANLFIDAFVDWHNRAKPVPASAPWIAINWDGWKFSETEKQGTVGAALEELAITPEQGLKAFQYIFSSNDNPRLIVSTGDLQARYEQWIQLESSKKAGHPNKKEISLSPSRPNLTKSYAAPGSKLEMTLASLWQEFFGFQQVGINDDFFELGGDSLKAISMISNIHRAIGVEIPLAEFSREPTIDRLAKYITNAEQKEYFSIEPTEKKEYYVLSSAQKRLYILQQMESNSTAYNVSAVTPLPEEIDIAKSEEAFKKLINRHESLRTSFEMIDNEPVQRIHHEVEFKIGYHETGSHRSFIQPFDLSRAPLLRVVLIKLLHTPAALRGHPSQEGKEGKYLLMIDMHHIITDGISQDILEKEFMALYSSPGEELACLRLQYKDFSEWQNKEKQKDSLAKCESYWITLLSPPGELPVLSLPIDYPRPLMQSFEGHSLNFTLGEEETRSLKHIAKKSEATLYMILLAVFTILLSKLSGQEDIIVGTPTAGRRHTDIEQIIGMFVNTLAMRNYPAGEKTVEEFLHEVKERTLEAFENQEYQFEDLVDRISVPRDTSRNPIFDVMFNLLNPPDFTGDIPGIVGQDSYGLQSSTSKFDLSLTAVDMGHKISCNLEYCTRIFKPGTIQRFISYFRTILSVLSTEPVKTLKLSAIEIITKEEKEKILEMSRGVEELIEPPQTIQCRFENQAAKTPDHVALIGQITNYILHITNKEVPFSDIQLTYKELNERANQLARLVIKNGVKTGTIVGIMVERSAEMIVGILAILKAGGAYLPVDMEYPQKRKKYMLQDSQVKLLLTNDSRAIRNDIPGDIEIIDLEDQNIYSEESSNPQHFDQPSDLLYMIYTSGSTGKPRGVMLEHRNLVNLIVYQYKYTTIDFSRVLQFTTISFDVSFQEIFSTLIAGGKLFLVDKETRNHVPRLFKFIEKNEINTLFLPTSYLKFVLSEENYIDMIPGSVAHIVTAGEQLAITDEFKKYLQTNGVYLHNHYGPTETHVVTTLTLDPAGELPDLPAIGKPIANTGIYILDRSQHLQVIGVPGELYIGGIAVGRGYWKNEQLTTERFLPNPFSPAERIYRTGDLSRWLPDGNIEFLGRIDLQVKIRGFRVEPEEIENQLLNHLGIKETVVLAREDHTGNKYLCAYIVSNRELAVSKLREHLAKNLPGYMIPSYFVHMKKIPLTPNGKIHRKALPLPELTPVTGYEAPRNEIEKKLTEIWQQILGFGKDTLHEKIGINDNFFELGGHSLKAAVLTSRIHKELHVKIPLGKLFGTPTIKSLSHYIKENAREDKFTPIEPAEEREYYELSPTQLRLYILQQMEAQNTGYNMPAVISLEGDIKKTRFEKTFLKLTDRHESLRTSFHMIEAQPLQKIHNDVEFEIEYHQVEGEKQTTDDRRQTTEEGRQTTEGKPDTLLSSVIRHLSSEFIRSFDLSQAPLLRVGLIEQKESPANQYLLMVDMHHIITDGTSLGILVKEFVAIYSGEELPPLKIRFKDYAQWQNQEKQRQEIKKQEAYWLKEFQEEIPVLDLPIDYARPGVQSFEGSTFHFELEEKETERLKKFALREGATLFMVLLALYNILLSKLSSQEDIVMGTPVRGRRHTDLEEIIGMFVNTLALRNYPTGQKTFKEFLQEIKTKTLNAFENQDYPFEELVERVVVNREAGRNPLFDVMLIQQNLDIPGMEIPGLKLTPYDYEYNISRFDLTFTAVEAGKKLFFTFEYCTKLFKQETIQRFARYFQEIISAVIDNTDRKISGIEMIPQEELDRIVKEFNNTEMAYPQDKTIHGLFSEQVERTPDQIALIGQVPNHTACGPYKEEPCAQINDCGQGYLSYRELDEKSNQLAYVLKKRGVQPDSLVALIIQRSVEMIIGILGILKAGGAYLPIDIEYPDDRINYMLKDSRANVILTNSSRGRKSEIQISKHETNTNDKNSNDRNQSMPVVVLNFEHLDFEFVSDFEFRASNFQVSPTNLAYIIYTSGTTGRPKGVIIEHRQVLNTLLYRKEEYHMDLTVVSLQLFSFTFDGFVTSFFTPVISGSRQVILDQEGSKDPTRIKEAIAMYRITHFICVPALFQAIVEILTPLEASSLRTVTLAGDTISSFILHLAKKLKQDIEIVNEYGITEASVMSTIYRHQQREEIIQIGKPIRDTHIYIINKQCQLQGLGIPGELCIAGTGVARGYLNNTELTAEKFDHDFWDYRDDRNGYHRSYRSYMSYISNRTYKTGDLARWLADGNIEFLGRIDQQVKIRGFRIELAEIETHLIKHKEIKQCVTVTKQNKTGDKYLCAYIVSNRELTVEELRKHLAAYLPDYMIPSFFVNIKEIPLTPNGKIDRKALPSPDINTVSEYVPPGNEIEKKLAEIWLQVLDRFDPVKNSKIGILDNFFELGGHSLTATRLITDIHRELNVKISLGEIFKSPTIKGLSRHIRKMGKMTYTSILPVEEKGYYPASSAQKRMFISRKIKGDKTISDSTPELLLVEGNPDKRYFKSIIRKLIKRHDVLRTSFEVIDKQIVQRVHPEVDFEIEYFNIRYEGEEQKIIRDFIRPFDLEKAPIFRVGLFRLAEAKHILIYDMHHIINDGTSGTIFIRDFISLYNGLKLPVLNIQYKDFSAWQNTQLQSKTIKKQQKYWSSVFPDVNDIPVLALPTDYPRPPVQILEGSGKDFQFERLLTKKIKSLVSEDGTTLYMVLLAIYNILLARLSGQEDFVVGVPIQGRQHPDLRQAIGFFVNTLPIRNYPQKEKTFCQFLNEVKFNALNAYENQDYQLEELVAKLGIPPDPSRQPLFSTVLEHSQQPPTQKEYPAMGTNNLDQDDSQKANLSFTPYQFETKIIQFDLLVHVFDLNEYLGFRWVYSTKLFKTGTIKKFFGYFKEIAGIVSENKNIKLKDIKISHGFIDRTLNNLKNDQGDFVFHTDKGGEHVR